MISQTVLFINEEQRKLIRENVKVTKDLIESGVQSILEWYKKQHHLPRIDLDPRMIECLIISRKGSIEQVKQKIDMMYSIRNIIPEMAAIRDILHPKIQNALKGLNYAVLPKLNHDLTRVQVIQYGQVEFFNVVDVLNYVFMITELRLLHDYFAGDRYIFDFENLTLGHITKYTPSQIKHTELYTRKAFGIRIFGVHIVNGSSIVNKLIALFKAGLSEKIGSRINTHANLEDLYKYIDQDILPADFGGKEAPIIKLVENWNKELIKEENRRFFVNHEKLRSNEALRIGSKLDDELHGVAGTFRNLNVD